MTRKEIKIYDHVKLVNADLPWETPYIGQDGIVCWLGIECVQVTFGDGQILTLNPEQIEPVKILLLSKFAKSIQDAYDYLFK